MLFRYFLKKSLSFKLVTKPLKEYKDHTEDTPHRKANFDVEMAMDMLDDADKLTAVMLCSGDSDLLGPLERLKVKGKHVAVVGVRGRVADELHRVKDKYIDFGKFYTGKRTYLKSENPALGGTA